MGQGWTKEGMTEKGKMKMVKKLEKNEAGLGEGKGNGKGSQVRRKRSVRTF